MKQEGLDLSKVKKSLAVVLAAAMILSCSPLAFAASSLSHPDGTLYTEGNGYSYNTDSFTNPQFSIWTDTSGTTRTWRLNGGAGSLSYGNYLTRATQSGIPENGYTADAKYYATAGEEVEDIKIQCKIYGPSSPSAISGTGITQSALLNFNTTELTPVAFSDSKGSGVKLEWVVNPVNTTCSSGPNTNLVFDIQFTYGGVVYHTSAYGHTEYISMPTGNKLYQYYDGSSKKVRACLIYLLYCGQSRTEWASTMTDQRGRINFNNFGQATNGEILGCGSGDSFINGSLFEADSTYGTIVSNTTGTSSTGSRTVYEAWDANRSVRTIWLDKSRDHLGTGTSGTLTNGLNFRLTVKNGEPANNDTNVVHTVGLYDDGAAPGGNQDNNVLTAVNGVEFNQEALFPLGSLNLNSIISNYESIVNGGYTTYMNGVKYSYPYLQGIDYGQNNGTYGDTHYPRYILIRMKGSGPSASWFTPNLSGNNKKVNTVKVMVCCSNTGNDCKLTTANYRHDHSGSNDIECNYINNNTALGYRFRVYTTAKLREAIEKINSGTSFDSLTYGDQYSGLSSTTANITSPAKGKAFPQEFQYTSASWSTFKTAYDKANSLVADFTAGIFTSGYSQGAQNWTYSSFNDITIGKEQKNIDNALKNLLDAYNALVPKPSPKLTVEYKVTPYGSQTSVTAADSKTYTGWDSNNNLTDAANPAVPFVNGVSVNIYALASLMGYEVSGAASVTDASLVADDNGISTLYNSFGNAIGTPGTSGSPAAVYTFNYVPSRQTLQVYPFNGSNIYTSGTGNKPQVVTAQTPDFATIAQTNGGTDLFNFSGFYEAGDVNTWQVSGNPIDTSTWKMPYNTVQLYEGWVPKPVELKVITSYGEELVASTQTPTVTTTVKDGNLNDVTFSLPAAPDPTDYDPSLDSLTFVGYYLYDLENDCVATYNGEAIPVDAAFSASYDAAATFENYATEVNNLVPIQITQTTQVMTPVTNKVAIYAEYFESANQIFFDPQGGDMPEGFSADNTLEYTTGTPFTYPIPTRNGYMFTGWVDENGNPINSSLASVSSGSWTVTDATTKTGVSAVEGGTITMNSANGFVCLATWAPMDVVLTYRLDIPATETSRFNSKDSAASPYYSDTYDADTPVLASQLPNPPRRFGYIFNFWSLDGRRFQAGTRTPTTNATLHAQWADAKEVAFADLTSYIKYSGEDKSADLQHEAEIEAAPGDTVNIRFIVCGKFYSASSSFIFGYNKNFYEEITGVDVIRTNEDNDYISGICADVTRITNYPGTIADYTYDALETANTEVLMITVDPDVTAMGTYNTVTMEDDEYMIEIKLKIKDTAPQGSEGSVWLALDKIRSHDNIMGDLFISYTEEPAAFNTAQTDKVRFDTNVLASTVKIAEPARPNTTLHAILPADDFSHTGTWADTGRNDTLELTGKEGTEILKVEFDSNTTYTGFPMPEKEGYTFDGFFEWDTDTSSFVENGLEWVPGCYATDEQNGKTFAAKWTAEPCTYTFYMSTEAMAQGEAEIELDLYYDWVPAGGTFADVPDPGSDGIGMFHGWIEYTEPFVYSEENIISQAEWDATHVTGDKVFIAYVTPTPKQPYVAAYKNGSTSTPVGSAMNNANNRFQITYAMQEALGIELVYGTTLHITEASAIPATPEEGHIYVSLEQIDYIFRHARSATPDMAAIYPGYTFIDTSSVQGNVFSATNSNNYEPLSMRLDNAVTEAKDYTLTFAGGNTPTIYVEYQAGIVEDRWSIIDNSPAATGTWDNGTYASNIRKDGDYLYISGRYGNSYDYAELIASHAIAPFGYYLSGWTNSTNVTYGGTGSSTHHADYTAYDVNIHFYTEDGLTEMRRDNGGNLEPYVPTRTFAQSITSAQFSIAKTMAETMYPKIGYDFAGWLPATIVNNVVTPIAGRSLVTDTYDIDAAENDPENTIVVTTGNNSDVYDLYFVASYTIKNFGVTYNVDNALYDNTTQNEVQYGSTFTVLAEPTAREGYTFNGWYDSRNSSTKVNALSTATMDAEGITYNGTFDPNMYGVNFDANTGTYATNPNPVPVAYDAQITEPATLPTKAGYTLIGWAESANAATPDYRTGSDTAYAELPALNSTSFASADFSTPETVVKTLYAVWEADEAYYSIEFYYETLTDGTYEIDSSKTIANDDNYKADVDSTASVPAELIASNVTTGFSRAQGGNANDVLSGTVPATGTLVLKVYYERDSYNIYTVVDGVTTNTYPYVYGDDISQFAPAAPADKEGHYFDDWSWVPARPADEKMPAEDITLTAAWLTEAYTIKYNINGATGTQPADEQNKAYGTTFTLASDGAFAKTGHTFDGWYLGDANSCDFATKIGDAGVSYTVADLGANGDQVTLWAKWVKGEYKLKLNLDGGTYASAPTGFTYDNDNGYYYTMVTYGDPVAEIAAPSKLGYDFVAWVNGGANVNFQTFTMPAFEVEFKATWSAINYTIAFNSMGGSAVSSITQGYDTSVAKPADPTLTGYTFTGWYTSDTIQDMSTLVNWPVTMPLNGTTYYAGWSINNYKVYYNLNDDATDPAQFTNPSDLVNGEYIEVEYNAASIPAPAATRGNGYTQSASEPWTYYTDSNYSTEFTGSAMPAQDLYAKANWDAEEFTISFNPNGGALTSVPADYTEESGIYTATLAYGDAVPAIGTPGRAGYDFDGWGNVPNTMPKENISFTASWTAHVYNVVYNIGDATNIDITINSTVTYSDSPVPEITLPVFGINFEYTGWSFDGWYYNNTKIETAAFEVPALASSGNTIELTARYTQNEYTVYFMDENGTDLIGQSSVLHYNDSIASLASTVPADFSYSNPGKDFAGWCTDTTLANFFNDWTFMPANDIYVYAKWTDHEYSVVFYAPDDLTGATQPTTFTNGNEYATVSPIVLNQALSNADVYDVLNPSLSETPYPVVSNYDFYGWALDPATAPADAATSDDIFSSAEIYSWVINDVVDGLAGDIIAFYPIYDRTPVEIVLSSDEADIVDKTETPGEPAVGYIYNTGDFNKVPDLRTQLEVQGDGTIDIFPSKLNTYCGTGTKVTVTDNMTDEVVEVYYLIVFGDVEGDATCNSNDYGIIASQVGLAETKRTWELGDNDDILITELPEEDQILCECYVRAADANGDTLFTGEDASLIQLYVLRVLPYEYDDQEKHRYQVEMA